MKKLVGFVEIDSVKSDGLNNFKDETKRLLTSMVKNGFTINLAIVYNDELKKDVIDYYYVSKGNCSYSLENIRDVKIWFDGYLSFCKANSVFYYRGFGC